MGEVGDGSTAVDPLSSIVVSLQEPVVVFPDHLSLEASQHDQPVKIRLSPLDRQTPFYSYIVLFYSNQAHRDTESLVHELETALQKALVLYFPLSGRLRRSSDDDMRGYLEIDCSNEGVLLVEAQASVKDEALSFLHDDVRMFDPKLEERFIYQLEPKEDNPLLTVQITQLSSGAFVLGVGRRHEMADGFGFHCFLQTWADIARGKPVSSIPLPCHSRQSLQPKPNSHTSITDWQNHLKSEYQGIPIYNFPNEKLAREVIDTPSFISSPQYITKIFPITKLMIVALKEKAMKGGSLLTCTTFEALITHLWRARVKAFEMQAHERALLSFTVNGRSRRDPPLPEYYVGNAFVVTSINCGVDDLLQSPFHAIVEMVQKAKARVGEDYIANMLAFLDDVGVKALSSYRETSIVTDLTKFPLHKVDFGWGAANFITSAALPLRDVTFMLRTGLEGGGVSLRVGLPAPVMLEFEKYLYQLT